MSNNNLYAVFDSCSGIFADPMVCNNDASAIRIFNYFLSDPSVPDYVRKDAVLYAIGFYDSSTGLVSRDYPPYVVARGCNVQPRPTVEVTTNEE